MTICFRSKTLVASSFALGLGLLSNPSFAQDADDPASEEAEEEVDLDDEVEEESELEDSEVSETDPEAKEGSEISKSEVVPPSDEEGAAPGRGGGASQLLVGARYRMVGVPGWLINMFGVEGGRGVLSHTFGGEAGVYWGETSNGFVAMLGVFGGKFDMEPTPFRDGEWEIVESDLSATFITVDAMWDHKIIDRVSLNVGLGVGVGIVGGSLTRDEAVFPVADGTPGVVPSESGKDWPTLLRCEGPGSPDARCPAGDYGEADKWPVYPWINFQMGVRYQPIDEFVGRLDFGLGSTGFWVGLGADYAHFL